MVPILLEGVSGPFVFEIGVEQKQPLCFERNRGAEKGSVRAGWRVRASVSSTRRQYFSTEGMKQRSLGVWGDWSVGPNETTSMPGQWLKITEHSNPACTTCTFGSSAKRSL